MGDGRVWAPGPLPEVQERPAARSIPLPLFLPRRPSAQPLHPPQPGQRACCRRGRTAPRRNKAAIGHVSCVSSQAQKAACLHRTHALGRPQRHRLAVGQHSHPRPAIVGVTMKTREGWDHDEHRRQAAGTSRDEKPNSARRRGVVFCSYGSLRTGTQTAL